MYSALHYHDVATRQLSRERADGLARDYQRSQKPQRAETDGARTSIRVLFAGRRRRRVVRALA